MNGIRLTSWSPALNLATNVVTIAVALYFVWAVRIGSREASGPAVPSQPIGVDGAAIKGDLNAPVALIEYSDFECSFCGKFARNTLPILDERFTSKGKLVVIFRHRPLETIHTAALRAAAAADCAGRQGAFWPMHGLLFSEPPRLAPADIERYVSQLKLDEPAFRRCQIDPGVAAAIRRSNSAADDLGLRGTPIFLIGKTIDGKQIKVSRVIEGAKPTAEFVDAIGALLDSQGRLP